MYHNGQEDPAIDSDAASPGMCMAVGSFLLKQSWKPEMDDIFKCLGKSLFFPKGAPNETTQCPPHCCHFE